MWLRSAFVPVVWSLAAGVAVLMLLILLSSSRPATILMSVVLALVYGSLTYSISQIIGLAVLIAIQVGLMHYCALLILGSRRRRQRDITVRDSAVV
jgi:hypothetical protein